MEFRSEFWCSIATAEQSKGMQRYHEFCLKSALKLLILGWVVVINIKPHSCLILVTGSHSLIFSSLKAALGLRSRASKAGETSTRAIR
jgi:hypothetical protein